MRVFIHLEYRGVACRVMGVYKNKYYAKIAMLRARDKYLADSGTTQHLICQKVRGIIPKGVKK